MSDLEVDRTVVATFASALASHAGPVGAECVDAAHALGSGVVRDALGNVALVLAVLDRASADGASALARDGRSAGDAWASVDRGLIMPAG